MSIEVMAVLGSAIGGLISFFLGCSVGRWAKSRAFRRSVLERDVQRIVVNPSSDNPRTFVPESENAKLRELAVLNWEWAHSCCGNNCKMWTNDCGYQIDRDCNYEREIYDRMRELGVVVE